MQTVKNLLRKSTGPYVALFLYRATPLENGFAPSELLMGRKLKTKLPSLKKTQTSNSHLPLLFQKEQRYRDNQRDNFNRRHAVLQAPELRPCDSVHIKDLNRSGPTPSTHMPVRPETTHLSSGPTFRIAPPLFYMFLLAAVHGSARRF